MIFSEHKLRKKAEVNEDNNIKFGPIKPTTVKFSVSVKQQNPDNAYQKNSQTETKTNKKADFFPVFRNPKNTHRQEKLKLKQNRRT